MSHRKKPIFFSKTTLEALPDGRHIDRFRPSSLRRIQANYVIWRAAAASVSYLTEELRKRQLEYSTELSGRTEREPRWKECVDISSGSFSLAIGSLYVRRFFDEDAKKNALEMVNGIREEMYKILSSIDWMDETTR